MRITSSNVRLGDLMRKHDGEIFLSHKHRSRFQTVCRIQNEAIVNRTPSYLATLFLLTADDNLWCAAKDHIYLESFDFKKMHLNGSNTDGYETIDLYNNSETRGRERSYGTNYQKVGKELMTMDELSVMDSDKCILQLRGVRPFLSNKFDITKHKNYPLLGDYDKKNNFDIEKEMKTNLRFRRNQMVDVTEIDITS